MSHGDTIAEQITFGTTLALASTGSTTDPSGYVGAVAYYVQNDRLSIPFAVGD
jgi:hypothetical protein